MKLTKTLAPILAATILLSALAGCGTKNATETASTTETTVQNSAAALTGKYDSDDTNAEWSASDAASVKLGTSIQVSGEGAAADGGNVVISKAGTYVMSGTLTDGQIIVKAADTDLVRIVLNGADITCKDNAPIWVQSAKKAVLILADGTKNMVTDGRAATTTTETDAPDAAVYSENDLSITGSGALTVNGGSDKGISTKDDLVVTDGTLQVTAAGVGLRGHDSVSVKDGTLTIHSGEDGIQSNNDEDTDKGWIALDGGDFNIQSGNDGVQAETLLAVNAGTFTVTTGGGSANAAVKQQEMGGMRLQAQTNIADTAAGGTAKTAAAASGSTKNSSSKTAGSSKPAASEKTASRTPQTPPAGALDGTPPSGAPKGTPPSGEPRGNQGTPPSDSGSTSTNTNTTATDTAWNTADATMAVTELAVDTTGATAAKITEKTTDSAASAAATESESDSCKAFKAGGDLAVNGGTITVDSKDDSIHTNGNLLLAGGTLTLQSGDDGAHADGTLVIEGGTVTVKKSYEGLEGSAIEVNGGEIHVTASDDGVNAAGGSDTETTGGKQDNFNASGCDLTINGGTLVVGAQGDGLDANGNITINGGTTLVDGPTNSGNGALDNNGTFQVNGGTLVAAGSAGMAVSPDTDSKQASLSITYTEQQAEKTLITITAENGKVLLSYQPSKVYQNVIVSAPDLTKGKTYTVSSGGTNSGTAEDAMYSGGTVSGSTKLTDVKLSDMSTRIKDDGTAVTGGSGMGGPSGGMSGPRGGRADGGATSGGESTTSSTDTSST